MLNLDKNRKYLLACSYGPDSMALFSMLLKEGYQFDVAHVNYHFRKESDQEEDNLRRYCFDHNVNIYVYDNKEVVRKNLEAKAREIRYNFFKYVYSQNDYEALLVAHHQDDLLETYLLQIKRNLHPNYYGIARISSSFDMKIIRPLLDCTKESLLKYCEEKEIPYMIDESNFDLTFDRNKIRHEVISKLTEEDRYNLLREIKFKNEAVEHILSNLKSVDIHSCEVLSKLNEDEIIYAIQTLANECQIFKISQANLKEIIKIILSKKANVILKYKSYSFVKEYERCYFSLNNEPVSFSYIVNEPEKLDTPYFYLDFRGDASNRNVRSEDYPLTIRNAEPNDQIRIKDYYKKARRLFIDWKMPVSLRRKWPLIVNKDGVIIYIPRYQKDFKRGKNLNFYVK